MEIRLAPSDFAYLYEECPRCTWLKLVEGVTPERSPMPGIFSKIDSYAKGLWTTREALESIGITGYTPIKFGKKLKSAPIFNSNYGITATISGIPDLIWRHDDGHLAVPDLKTTDPKDHALILYQRQLMGYAEAIMRPNDPKALQSILGPDLTVKEILILAWNPFEMQKTQLPEQSLLCGNWTVHKLPFDIEAFWKFLNEIFKLCASPMPLPGPKCGRCDFFEKRLGVDRRKIEMANLVRTSHRLIVVPGDPPTIEVPGVVAPGTVFVEGPRASGPGVRRSMRG